MPLVLHLAKNNNILNAGTNKSFMNIKLKLKKKLDGFYINIHSEGLPGGRVSHCYERQVGKI